MFAVALAIACIALPAIAMAAPTLSNQVPAPGTVMNQSRFQMQYTITNDKAFILPPELKVDGLKTTTKSYTTPSWSGTSYIAVITATSPLLNDGAHTATVRVRDANGNHTLSWDFSTGFPPTIASPQPVPGTVVSSTSPVISAAVSDANGIATRSMTINGLAVPTTFTGGVVTAQLPAPLADFQSYLVVVSATDTTGLTSTFAWSFEVQSVPKMAVPVTTGCTDCHTAYSTAHPVDDCAACHGVGSPQGGGYTDPAQSHAPGTYCSNCHARLDDCTACHNDTYSTVPVLHDLKQDAYHSSAEFACDPCHYQMLTIEHAQHLDDSGQPYDCATCHASTAANVVAAIDAGDTRCGSCHGAGHQAVHESSVGSDCAVCHQPNLVTEHTNRSLTCDTCHQSTDPLVVDAIATGDKSCSACHGATDHMVVHEATVTPPCSDCHGANLVTEHVTNRALTCDTCHASTDSGVQAAIDAGITACEACHGATGHLEVHASTVAPACADCHSANVVTEHVTNRSLTCATCHSSSDSAVIAAIAANDTSCAACHGTVDHMDLHASAVDPACSDCHASNVVTEHVTNRALTCVTCHSSTDSAVIAAIAANDTSCSACHVGTGHVEQHASTVSPPCSDCHVDNVITEHVTNRAMTCGTCHSSTDPAVTAAIAANDTSCAACHGTVDHMDFHVSAVAPPCSDCHVDNVITEHTNRSLTCATCHQSTDPSVAAAIAANDTSCAACHGTVDHMDFHVSTVSADCAACHDSNVITEHVANQALTCATCHQSTDPSVTAAIAANDTSCAACHGSAAGDHGPVHDSTVGTDCASCHEGNLVTEHVTNQALTCATCHASANPTVTTAIETHDKSCTACHGANAGDHGPVHDSTVGADCSSCHDANLVTEHVTNQALTCASCHDSVDPTVTAAIAANDTSCGACHGAGAGDHGPIHDSTLSANCSSCHQANLVTEHDARSVGCAACHQSTDATVQNAIATHDKACLACHSMNDHPYTPTAHTANVASVLDSGVVRNTAGVPYTQYTGATMTYGNQPCGQCHLMDLAAEHGKPSSNVSAQQCAACHAQPRDSFGSWNKTCQQGDCHPAYHAGMSTKHAQTYGTATYPTGCGQGSGNCHSGYWPVGDVAAIHNYVWFEGAWFADIGAYTNGCRLCHKSNTAVPATTVTCGACHTAQHGAAVTPW